MSVVILLDAGPLGLATNPKATNKDARACALWLESLIDKGMEVFIPEITDYEVRRELLRANKTQGIGRLNELKELLNYLPLSTSVMLKAAHYWALARQRGQPTADDTALDGDVILAAQAAGLQEQGYSVVVATTNVKHLQNFVNASHWQDIA